MGWERKRGKLAQFNRYLLSRSADTDASAATAVATGVAAGAASGETINDAVASVASDLSLAKASADPFVVKVGNLQALRQVRYVITLDADTSLPRDSARRLVATLAHPLNRPCFDEGGTRGERLFHPPAPHPDPTRSW